MYMLKCISKNIVYRLNRAKLLNYTCKINKKDQYLHYLNKIYMIKCISKNIIFTCIPLNDAYLLNYKCKIYKKDQYLH